MAVARGLRSDENELHPLVVLLTYSAALASGVWATWCVVVAFVGGTMPIIGWTTGGSISLGLIWLIVLEPIAITVAYWATLLVLFPVSLMVGLNRATPLGRRRRNPMSAYRVTWPPGRYGVSFRVVTERGVPRVHSWFPDPAVPDDITWDIIVEQELGELEVALGRKPSLQYKWPRPEFIPEAVWDPRLPTRAAAPPPS
jgi:hypothetical protein